MQLSSAKLLVNEARRLRESGNPIGAEEAARAAIEASPRELDAWLLIAELAVERDDWTLAESSASKAAKLAPRDPRPLCLLGHSSMSRGRFRDAVSHYEKARRFAPNDQSVVAALADLFERQNRLNDARRTVDPFVKSGRASLHVLFVFARLEQLAGRHDAALELGRRVYDDTSIHINLRTLILRLAAVSLATIGEFDQAFAMFHHAAEVLRPPYDPSSAEARVSEIIRVFSSENLPRFKRSYSTTELPILIVGMPRSGSTLIEQIIHAHPLAHGAGEVPHLRNAISSVSEEVATTEPYPVAIADWSAEHMNRLAAEYTARLQSHAPRATRIVDKSLRNFERLGMIALALPKARIIHARRHPMDTCLSCYFHALSPRLHPFAMDLHQLGVYFQLYAGLMRHWHETLDLNMLEVDYESLVENPEQMTQRIIEFIGLPWDDRCLVPHQSSRDVATMSYSQVREPIHRAALLRHLKYDKHLGPLRDSIGAFATGWPPASHD